MSADAWIESKDWPDVHFDHVNRDRLVEGCYERNVWAGDGKWKFTGKWYSWAVMDNSEYGLHHHYRFQLQSDLNLALAVATPMTKEELTA